MHFCKDNNLSEFGIVCCGEPIWLERIVICIMLLPLVNLTVRLLVLKGEAEMEESDEANEGGGGGVLNPCGMKCGQDFVLVALDLHIQTLCHYYT